MKRGYRLNSTISFNQYEKKTANFYFGQGIVKAGLQKVDDAVAAGGNMLRRTGVQGRRALGSEGRGGMRDAMLQQGQQIGQGIANNASTIRNGLGIAGGVGAVGLGGAALANRNQQRPMGM